jgi:hypothetical protein
MTLGAKGTGIDMLIYGFLIMMISMYYPEGVWKLLARIGAKKTGTSLHGEKAAGAGVRP